MERADRAQSGKSGASDRGTVPLSRGLSTKLLLLTILFVLLAEVLIFLPSIANFRLRWLEERLGTAAAVASCWCRAIRPACRGQLQDDVLMSIGAKAIAVRDGGVSRLARRRRNAARGRRAYRSRRHRPAGRA